MSSAARRTRGLLALVLTTSLAGATLVGTAPGVSAAPALDSLLEVQALFDSNGPVTCAVTTGASSSTAVPVTNAGRTRSVNEAATVTDSADAGDVTQLTASATATAKVTTRGGSLAAFDLRATARASAVAAQGPAGTECDADVDAEASLRTQFTLSRAGWLDLEVTKTLGPGTALYVLQAVSGGMLEEIVVGHKGHHTRTVLLGAGDYLFGGQISAERDASMADRDGSIATSATVHAQFTPAGGSAGPTQGAGKRFLVPAAERGCGAGTLSARWTGKAGQVRSSAFFVNQRRVKTVRKPRAGSTVTLRGLPAGKEISLLVVHTLRTGRTSQVSTSYRACS